MLAAASMGATAFQKGLGAIHSLSHPVGALYDTHHGLTNAVFMPYVLAFNRPAIEDRLVRLAAWLGLKNPSFNAVQDWVLALREELKISAKLDGLGVDGARIDEIAAMAAEDPTAPTNPRSEAHTSELQSLMSISYAVFCLKKKRHKLMSDA